MLIKLKNIIYIAIIIITFNKDSNIVSNIGELVAFYKSISNKFNSFSDLNSLINQMCLKKIVMLGESTHG
ncbi:hypothetical protein JXR93_11835, partial [bacterium]|nr:hypothetical protein [bacterium]